MATTKLATAFIVAALVCAIMVTGEEAEAGGGWLHYPSLDPGVIPCNGRQDCHDIPANPYQRGCEEQNRCRTGHR
ncbi:unnamed protein product [Linum trigynum]|uniref:Uncharacterized protein n=1 Tax=Linum trigynum TaxID=586398 RepID=A0AAV2D6D6_9ROSI